MKMITCGLSLVFALAGAAQAQSIPTTATAHVKIVRVELNGSTNPVTVLCDASKSVAIANWLGDSRKQPEVTNFQCKTTLNGLPKIANVGVIVLLTKYAVFDQPVSVRRIYVTLSYGTGSPPVSEDPANFYRTEIFESRDLNLSSALIGIVPHGSVSLDDGGFHASVPEYIAATIEVSNP